MSSAGHYGPDGQRSQVDREALVDTSRPLYEVELGKIDETVDSARRVIEHVAIHTTQFRLRALCQEWLDLHPEPDA